MISARVFFSNEGLDRAGPQWLVLTNPFWMSIRRRAVLGCGGLDAMLGGVDMVMNLGDSGAS